MNASATPRTRRLRRMALMMLTVVGAIVAAPFMLILLFVRLGYER